MSKKSKGSLIVVNNGHITKVGGHGKLLEDFIVFKQIVGYNQDDEVAFFSDPNFETVRLRVLKFAETYHKMSYDVRKCMCY